MPSRNQRRSAMRSGVGLLALAATAAAQRVVPMSITRAILPENPLDRRGSVSSTLANNRTAYFTKWQIGTPPQTVTLQVDTGSSDLWVLSKDSDLCTSDELQQTYGYCFDTFDASSSKTYQTLSEGTFSIRYVDETGCSGDYFTDVVRPGKGIGITDLPMGLAYNSTNSWGMLGIGYDANVAASKPHATITDLLYEQGHIATKAYSLYLDDYDSDTGTLLFGGVDTEKFYGQLKTVPIIPNKATGVYEKFTVSVTSIAGVSNGGHDVTTLSTANISVVLDSGTSLTYLPSSVVAKLYDATGAVDDTDGETGSYLVDCALRATDAHLSFQFNGPAGPVVNVSAAEYVLDDLKPYLAQGMVLPRGLPFAADSTCRMGVEPGDDNPSFYLGDTFLRSAYVVYDLSHNVVGLAQSNPAATGSKIVEIEKGQSVPSVTGAPVPTTTSKPVSSVTRVPLPSVTGALVPSFTRAPVPPPEVSGSGGQGNNNAAAGMVRPGLRAQVLGVAAAAVAFTLFGVGAIAL
ncbi:hypothetical protein VTK56DRAFT_3056 [Thermocarpiscus australiensis]